MTKKQLTFKKKEKEADIVLDINPKKDLVEKQESACCPSVMVELLQKQVDHEFANERLYLSMALWCSEKGYPETAKFFSKHAVEERTHGMKFINHMVKRKIKALPPSQAEVPQREFESMSDVLMSAVERELETSKMIGNLLMKSTEIGDIAYEIASEFMREQVEEEQLFNSLLNLYVLCDSKIDFEIEVCHIKENEKYKFGKL